MTARATKNTASKPPQKKRLEGHQQGSGAHLCMPEDARKRAGRRIAIARGHLESIQKMLENPDVYCMDVLLQLKAVQGALSGAGDVVLRGHLEAHVTTASARGDTTQIVDELMDALKYR
jgi:CsoR family transcriptional regulator, copper-sensing transcriptional repressor